MFRNVRPKHGSFYNTDYCAVSEEAGAGLVVIIVVSLIAITNKNNVDPGRAEKNKFHSVWL